jgi:L-threonylcarbamoyladenylate synthase
MITLNMDEYNVHKKTILKELLKSTFVYPTDTIYGIGCDATNEELVKKIRNLKKSKQPFSIIAPSKEWIHNNCEVTEEAEEWIRKLPGPYTLVLRLKNPKAIAKNVYNHDDNSVGVRMPNHWFLNVATLLKKPILTTSANITGNNFMTSIDDVDPVIRSTVDYIFYEGEKKGFPSTIVRLTGETVEMHHRKGDDPVKVKFPIKEISVAD